jgi:divalent metal cation (Fe/Co/Zn/Cd) transporter
MIIGVILILISILLLRESRSLLMGEAPAKKTLEKIIALAEADEAVRQVKRHYSIYLAPEEVVLQLVAIFKDNLTNRQITDAIERITRNIQRKFPRFKKIFIQPATGA